MAVLEQLAEEQKDFYHWQVENGGGYRTLVTKMSGSPAFTDFMKFKNWEAR